MEQPSGNLSISKDDLQEMLQALVKAAKEPSEADAAKIKSQLDKEIRARKTAQDQIMAEERAKKQRQKNCPHKKENGKWATGGQIVGGKYLMIICGHCQKPWFNHVGPDVMAEFNSGDRTLFGADPTGWSEVQPQPENIVPQDELTTV